MNKVQRSKPCKGDIIQEKHSILILQAIQPPAMNTTRLLLKPLRIDDASFIRELVNTEGWLQYIGDRHVHSDADAMGYIQKILGNKAVKYWVVKLKDDHTPVGVITFIQRDYLVHPDIGFAFLPAHAKKGYAYEASKAVMDKMLREGKCKRILATTIPGNKSSIQLLQKLGLQFEKEIKPENELLHVYGQSADKLIIDELTRLFFSIFNNTHKRQPNWDILHHICIPEAMIIKKDSSHVVYNLTSFIEPRRKLLAGGTLVDFEERETAEQTIISNNIAQRYSQYEKSGKLNGKYFKQAGHKLFQFIKTSQGWKISSVLWEDEE